MNTLAADVNEFIDYFEHFQRRVLQDALNEATAVYWRRRADQFLAARPRAGDHLPVSAGGREIDERLAVTAQACLAAASVALIGGDRE